MKSLVAPSLLVALLAGLLPRSAHGDFAVDYTGLLPSGTGASSSGAVFVLDGVEIPVEELGVERASFLSLSARSVADSSEGDASKNQGGTFTLTAGESGATIHGTIDVTLNHQGSIAFGGVPLDLLCSLGLGCRYDPLGWLLPTDVTVIEPGPHNGQRLREVLERLWTKKDNFDLVPENFSIFVNSDTDIRDSWFDSVVGQLGIDNPSMTIGFTVLLEPDGQFLASWGTTAVALKSTAFTQLELTFEDATAIPLPAPFVLLGSAVAALGLFGLRSGLPSGRGA